MRVINLITSPRPRRQNFHFPIMARRYNDAAQVGIWVRIIAPVPRIDGFIAHVKAISRDRGLCLVFGVGGGEKEARPFHYMPQRYDLRGAKRRRRL